MAQTPLPGIRRPRPTAGPDERATASPTRRIRTSAWLSLSLVCATLLGEGCAPDAKPEGPGEQQTTASAPRTTSSPTPPPPVQGQLAGQLVSSLGTPVAGADVRCVVEGAPPLLTKTDPTGAFQLRPPPGVVRLVARHPEFATQSLGPPLTFTAAGLQLGSVALQETNGLLVELRDALGAPLQGARVTAVPMLLDATLPVGFESWAERQAQSGRDGVAVLYGVPPGLWRVVASAAGHASQAAMCPQPQRSRRSPRLRLQLFRGRTLQGRVVDRSGNAVAEAELVCASDSDLPPLTARSGPDGSFFLTDLPEGAQRVRITHPDLGTRWRDVTLASPVTRVRWKLSTGLSLDGRAVAAQDGEPAAGVKVIMRTADGTERAVTTGEDGLFRFRGIAAGILTLRTRSDRWRPAILPPIRLDATSPSEPVKILLEPSRRIRGLVHAADQPLGGARVRLLRVDAPGAPVGPAVETGTDGSFVMPPPMPGRYRSQITHPDWPITLGPEFAVEAGTADLRLERSFLRSGTVLRGTVDAEPPREAKIYLVPVGIPAATLAIRPDANGTFRFPAVAAGSYRMFYDYPDKQLPTQAAACRASTSVSVTVKPTETPTAQAQDLQHRAR